MNIMNLTISVVGSDTVTGDHIITSHHQDRHGEISPLASDDLWASF